MPFSLTQAVLATTLAAALGFVWYYEGRGRWRALAADRLLYGVPWGTVVTATVLVGFYLFVQGGLRNWGEPLTLPFVSWSYFYPTGLFTSGIAHGSSAHLVSNLAGTLALAPIAEYAWSHYPPSRRRTTDEPRAEVIVADGGPAPGRGVDAGTGGLLTRPWVRALVAFPAALLAVAFLTALFSLGPGLGFSGALYAVAGFAVVTFPVATLVGVVAASALGTLYDALTEPVVRETIDPGTPGPPEWAGVGFQAHMLGFLLGVLVGIALLRYRNRRPTAERVFFATFLLGMVQALWLVALSGGEDTYLLYQGLGVVVVLALTVLITVAVAGSDRPLLRSLAALPRAPTARQLALGWLALVGLAVALSLVGAALSDGPLVPTLVVLVLLSAVLAFPALPPIAGRRWFAAPVTRRQAAVVGLAVATALVALPSVPLGVAVVDGGSVPGSGGIDAGDYTVTYEENATTGQTPAIDLGDDDLFASQQSGVIVVSDARELWTVGAREAVLEHEGNDTVVVGGVGWRETIRAERTGWDVAGNDTAYAVDLDDDGETVRSFTSDPVRAAARIDDHAIDVAPTDERFELRVWQDGSQVGAEAVPDVGESTAIGGLEFTTETVDDTARVFATTGDTRVQIAEREQYD